VAFPPNTFGAAPTARFLNAQPPAALGPVLVANTTRSSYRVRVRPVFLDQRLDGAFQPRLTRPALRAARRLVALGTSRFDLAPGRQQSVEVHWLAAPPDARSAAMAVLVEGQPRAGPQEGSGVGARAAILSLSFMQVPGPLSVQAGLVALHAEQGPRGKLLLLSRVRNEGRELALPSGGRVVVHDAGGRVVARRHWGGQRLDLVVPGATVDFPVAIDRLLPAGRYTAETSVRLGDRRTSQTTGFVLDAPNRLPTIRLRIASVDATGKAGQPVHVRLRVNNTGTAAAPLDAAVTLVRLGPGAVQEPVAERRLRAGSVRPGRSGIVEGDLGRLTAGPYRVEVSLAAGGGDRGIAATRVLARKPFSRADRLRLAVVNHPTRTLAIAALLVIAGLLAALLRTRRAVRRGSGPLPSQRRHVDLNTATAEQLAAVPGIGPVAARRIAAHRDEYGAFACVEDLAEVPGFDEARMARLREHLTAQRR
jgi:competence ComEA-like helix-hairpin-helix protein